MTDTGASALSPYRTSNAVSLPSLPAAGGPVDARQHIEPGTSSALLASYFVGALLLLVLTASTYGIFLIVLLISPLLNWFIHRRAAALIKGSGVRVGPRQLPQIHQAVGQLASRLGLANVPDVYVLEDAQLNAFALRLGKRQFVTLTDDLIDACVRTGNADALVFVLAHELAHVALGHNKPTRGYLRNAFRKLSRLDEYTADRVAMALVPQRDMAVRGIMIMTAGPYILQYIDVNELAAQASEVAADKYSGRAEKSLTHPLILNRLNRALQNLGR